MKKETDVIPILLGADLNAYSVARAFHEYNGVISHSFGRYKCGLTSFSKIVKAHTVTDLCNIESAGTALFDFAKLHKGKRLLLIPCADWYLDVAAAVSEHLSEFYCALIPSYEKRRILCDKDSFYKELKKAGISYPEYVSISREESYKQLLRNFEYPAVLKPSDSTEYWRNSFSLMRKVYFPKNADEAEKLCDRIFDSGYKGKIILQKRIGNGDEKISVYTTYSDRNGKVVRGVYGRVILEERGRTSYGNHCAIITDERTEICKKLNTMLEDHGYTGFANFDIISDTKQEYVLEMNPRQGRSCDYLRAAGVNIAEIMLKDLNGERITRSFEYGKVYWHYPEHEVVMKEVNAADREEAESFRRRGLSFSPLNYAEDFMMNPMRRMYVGYHKIRQKKHYANSEKG